MATLLAPPYFHTPFRFTGNGREYFRIWIVNTLLTILTLGIYSAWAKVRKKRYFYGNGRKLARKAPYYGDDCFFHHDMLGSVRLASADGGFIWSRDCMGFGLDRNAAGSDNDYKYTGQEDDNIGVYYYGARFYHPELGRFTQTDPLGSNYPGWSPIG